MRGRTTRISAKPIVCDRPFWLGPTIVSKFLLVTIVQPSFGRPTHFPLSQRSSDPIKTLSLSAIKLRTDRYITTLSAEAASVVSGGDLASALFIVIFFDMIVLPNGGCSEHDRTLCRRRGFSPQPHTRQLTLYSVPSASRSPSSQ